MKIIKNFKAALNYANYDLYKIKSEIVQLIIRGRKEGLGNPDYCKVTIKNSSKKRDYPVFIDLYYKISNDEVIHLPQELLIGTFASIKMSILNKIVNNGYIEIVIKNLAELYISEKEDVEDPISFTSILNFKPHKEFIRREVSILDEVFTYRVTYSYIDGESKRNTTSLSYANILNMPTDVQERIETEGKVILKID